MSEERARLQVPDGDEGLEPTAVYKSRAKRCLCIFGTVFFILLLIAAVVVLSLLLIMVGQQPARVVTSCGAVEGKFDAVYKVFSFKGIPYAVPPLRNLRWRPPESLTNKTCWKGVYYANEFKSVCIQNDTTTNQIKGSEDCLYMNIYTPTVDPEVLLPVMVYIHGGFLQYGDGSSIYMSPDEQLTNRLKMVFVSVQYRLNAFGFLVSDALPGRRGNYGFLDQIEALHWIQENIHAFGGNPNQVTIFGGSSVWPLMMSPLAKGLFHRVWMMSGSLIYNKTTEQAQKDNDWFLEKQSLKSACGGNVSEKCLLGLRAHTIIKALSPEWDVIADAFDLPTKNHFGPALAVIDGHFLPVEPYSMWEKKNSSLYTDVPLMIGNTAQEVDLQPTPGDDLRSWTQADFKRYVNKHLSAFGTSVANTSLTLYSWENDAEYVFTTMASDVRLICGTELLAKLASETLTSDVYRYIVESIPSRPVYASGMPFSSKYAFHGWDSLAFFWSFDQLFDHGPEQGDEKFGQIMETEMASFAKTGKPNDQSWYLYPNVTALISNGIVYTDAYHKQQCDFWIANGFFPYSWSN